MSFYLSRPLIRLLQPLSLLVGLLLLGGSVSCAPIDPQEALTNLQNPAAEETAVALVEAVGPEGAARDAAVTLADGTMIEYTVLLPPNYQVGQPYPTLLALPPGSQTANMVTSGLSSYWRDGAMANGWVIISPVAPGGQLFFQGAEAYIPAFLDQIAAQYPPEGGKFHLSGVSNGGISAFRVAGAHPERFHSLIVLPGYPNTAADKENLAQLTALPVALFVGENDSSWIAPMREAAAMLNNAGGNATLTVVMGEGHFIRSLIGGEQLFALLESFRRGGG
ncbi:MAG TPA: hypothetical protein P5121_36170 [Caldilineaceae bacterium]|nr:hypothetical protein [Caldilineaceae bacterium]